jgi:hypothetical protein
LNALQGRVRLADLGRELDPDHARYSESVVPLK